MTASLRVLLTLAALALVAAATASAAVRAPAIDAQDTGTQRMIPADVTAAMDAELAQRYGARWTAGVGTWSVCPQEEMWEADPATDTEAYGLCEFRFRDGAKWRHGDISFRLVDGRLQRDYFGTTTFTKTLRTCHIARSIHNRDPQVLDRHLRADGYVSCNDGPMLSDVPGLKPGVRSVGFHGTNRAGFDDAVSFRCVVKARSGGRRTATCANRLGDRFVYRYTLR